MRVLVIAALLVLAARPAAADERAASPPGDKAEALKFFRAGEQAYKMSNFIGAAQSFEAALKLLAAPEIAFSAAQAYRLQFQIDQDPRNARRAIELYEMYAAAVKRGKRAGDAAVHLDNLRAAYRDLVASGKVKDDKFAVDRTQLTVWVPVEGAAITVDGKPADAYAYLDVAPGEHEVAVVAKGYRPFRQKVSVASGAKVPVPVQLAPLPATVTLVVEAGARVAVDGRPVRAVGGKLELPAGKRFLTITRRGRKPFARELDLPPGGAARVEADLRRSTQRTVARWTFLGSAVLGGLTIVTVGGALYAQGQAEDRIGVTQDSGAGYARWRDRRDGLRTASIVFGSATFLAAGAATTLYLFDNPSPEAAPATVAPPADDDGTRLVPMAVVGGAGIGIARSW